MKKPADEEVNSRPALEISVRSLVEFLLVSGDIDERTGAVNPVNAMNEGSRVHRKIQKEGGADYHAEVPLSYTADFGAYDLVLRGRADGIIYDETALDEAESTPAGPAEESAPGSYITNEVPVTIDEIKGIYRDVNDMAEPVPVHLAQAKCYAYIFARDHGLTEISIRMTYINLDKEEQIQYIDIKQRFDELEAWFLDLLEQYKRWADFSFYWKRTRDASIRTLDFPYDYRPGQKKLVSEIYYCIDRGATLFLQAPTGSGKTLSTLFPSLKAMGEGKGDRIFYLTAKNVTRGVCEEALALLRSHGLAAKSVTLSAKDKACLLETPSCTPEACPYAAGFYDRLLDSLYDFLTTEDSFTRESIRSFAECRQLCPYYFASALSDWCDAIVCDYNYVFDPTAALSRFFGEGKRGDYIFLVDEAHNLVERGREMYSADLVKEDVLSVRKLFKTDMFGIKKALTRVNTLLNGWKKACEDVLYPQETLPGETDRLFFALMQLAFSLERYFDKRIENEANDRIRDFYFNVRFFLSLTESMEEGYVFYCDFDEGGRFIAHLFCADPSAQLQERLNSGRVTVFFSATLLPLAYYKRLLTREARPFAAFASSVFDRENLGLFAGTDVTSLYRKRSDSMYEAYVVYIRDIVSKRAGNYLAFFPSYSFMNAVYDRCSGLIDVDSTEILLQTPDMKEGEKEAFLAKFRVRAAGEKTIIGFCVMGGAFGEGIDLRGEALIGAIIAGAALPGFSHRTEILKNYFEREGMDGFSYAYLYPGMNRVLQAAGRVIRTEEDVGIVALLDSRFSYASYRAAFPAEWETIVTGDEKNLTAAIGDFWKKFSR